MLALSHSRNGSGVRAGWMVVVVIDLLLNHCFRGSTDTAAERQRGREGAREVERDATLIPVDGRWAIRRRDRTFPPRTLAPPEATITDIYAVVIRVSVESLGLRLVFRVRWGYYS